MALLLELLLTVLFWALIGWAIAAMLKWGWRRPNLPRLPLYGFPLIALVFTALSLAGCTPRSSGIPGGIACASPVAYDGDGPIRCEGQSVVLRLDAIDAPERKGSPLCRRSDPRRVKAWCDFEAGDEARDYLSQLLHSGAVVYRITGDGSYGRQSAKVYVDGQDVECAMVEAGHAKVRYGNLSC